MTFYSQKTVSIVMACHNRRDLTRDCINSIENFFPSNWTKRYFITDDGSVDNTEEMLNSRDLELELIKGPGNWFWAKSMYMAMSKINRETDGILLLNDDVILDPDSYSVFDQVNAKYPNSVLIGQMRSRSTQDITYGGFIRTSTHPLKLLRVEAVNFPQPLDTFNGNFVWIPWRTFQSLGPLDGKFNHSLADIDYGYRIRKSEGEILAIPGRIGFCENNQKVDHEKISQKFKEVFSPKKISFKSVARFYFRHSRFDLAVFYLTLTYFRAFFRLGLK